MAHIILQNNVKQNVSAAQGEKIWNVLQGITVPDDARQEAYCNKVVRIYLNWRVAPDSYVRQNLAAIIPFALHEWRVDQYGQVIKPATEFAWQFARKWGLWEHGRLNRKLLYGQPELGL